jgi:hypothetical protein
VIYKKLMSLSSSGGSNAQCFDMGCPESHHRRKNLQFLAPINILIPVGQGSHRFVELFETIRSHLESMRFHLQSINFYEDLYGSSTEMQNLFFNSYIHVLKFWSRVDKECQRCCKSRPYQSTIVANTEQGQSTGFDPLSLSAPPRLPAS